MNLPHLLACACLLGLASPSFAESPAPKETPLFVTASKEDDRMDERIFPLGWSADGKFAWLSRKVEEASDEGLWGLSILDTATNKVIEAVPYTLPDKPGDAVGRFWAKHGKAIQEVLTKHGIKLSRPVLDHLPLILGRRRNYVVMADLTLDEQKDDLAYLGVKRFKVNLRLGETKSVLLEKSYEQFFPFSVALAGCYHSPDEKYAVLVITALRRGWEGAPHPRMVETMAGFQLEEP